MSNGFDERQEVVERKEGYYWSVNVQLGKSSERIKAKATGNESSLDAVIGNTTRALSDLKGQVKEAHEGLTEEE